ncbi:MAG: hypothetical protein U1E42_06465 [Rhodospirillales bacterium]
MIRASLAGWRRIGAWVAGAAIGILAVPAVANAACVTADGNGTWDVYSTTLTGTPSWNRCSGSVTNGDVTGTCVTSTNVNNTVRGTLKVAANCRVTGSLIHTFPGNVRYTVTIAQATLGAADDIIIGVGRSSTGDAVTFEGIRR